MAEREKRCETCGAWAAHASAQKPTKAQCRRKAPLAQWSTHIGSAMASQWHTTRAVEWCLEWVAPADGEEG
jgi:hypothetical protein